MKIKGLNICSFDPYDEFGLPKGTRYRQHNNPFISFPKQTIMVDNSGQTNTFLSATSTSITSFTIGNNDNRILLVGFLFNGTPSSLSVTFNSVSMTLLQSYANGAIITKLYYLIAPTATTATISASWTGSSSGGIIGWSYYNVKQTSTFGTPAGFATHDASEASPIDVTQAVTTTVANSLVVGVGTMIGGVGGNTITLTAYTGNTQRKTSSLIDTNWVINCFDILAPTPTSTTGGYHAAWGANQTQDKGIIVCEMLQA